MSVIESSQPHSTPASVWQAAAGTTIGDDLLEWPPDLFAMTDLMLERSETHRFALAPPGGRRWPPERSPSWADAVVDAGRRWSAWAEGDGTTRLPDLLAEEWQTLLDGVETPLEQLAEGHAWPVCEALLTLHAIADEACAGLGVALDASAEEGCVYRARGRELLSSTGSLARIPSDLMRVLPKMHTPSSGSSVRSISRYACVRGPGVAARWHKMPVRRRRSDTRAGHANLLLLPWPLRVRDTDFYPLEGSVRGPILEPYGFFQFAPSEPLDLDLVDRMLVSARDEVDGIDVVMLPESAVDEDDINDLEAVLDSHGVVTLQTGVRQHPQPGQRPANWVHIGISPTLERGGSQPSPTGEPWFHLRQNKHHRWTLDEGQIYQYHLGGALHPHLRWWEAIDVPRRSVQIIEQNGLTSVALVCEDLAQNDSVADLIRSVGPTLVFTPLLDGPQLASRWAARYASVFADDPGSAVLTLTSYGMVQRCRPHDYPASTVIALWKNPGGGIREIPLESDAEGVILTACVDRAIRRSADGRLPIRSGISLFDVSVHQVRASTAGSGSRPSWARTPAEPELDTRDLAILTSWAEAVAETALYAPERVQTTLAEAGRDAGWRSELGIPEPSPQLSEAIYAMGQLVETITAEGGVETLEALLDGYPHGTTGEEEHTRLGSRVLLSALKARETRRRM